MIVDIVQLPRRLSRFNRHAEIISEEVFGFPISLISRIYGYQPYNDDEFIGVGSKHQVLTGKYTPFRYKIIEPTKHGIAEYFVMTESPIDIRCPFRSSRVKLFCPWVTITNPVTLEVRKFIIWNGVKDLIRYEVEDSVRDVPVELVLANEIRNFARLHGRQDVEQSVDEYPELDDNLVSEVKYDDNASVDMLTTLGANIKAYKEATELAEPFYWPDATEIFRGINLPKKWTDATLLKSCTLINHVIYGTTTIGDIRHLFGIAYDAHAFQRVFNDGDLNPYTELDISGNNDPDLFQILKYIESLCYSEFVIEVDNNGVCNLTLYNPYDPFIKLKADTTKFASLLKGIVAALKHGHPDLESTYIARSWASEAYITIKHGGKTDRYFFDLISATLGSRSLIKDYDGNLFN